MSVSERIRKLYHRDNLPRSRIARMAVGSLLLVGGIFGILPILGFWMIPLGLAILAIDVPVIHRLIQSVKGRLGLGPADGKANNGPD